MWFVSIRNYCRSVGKIWLIFVLNFFFLVFFFIFHLNLLREYVLNWAKSNSSNGLLIFIIFADFHVFHFVPLLWIDVFYSIYFTFECFRIAYCVYNQFKRCVFFILSPNAFLIYLKCFIFSDLQSYFLIRYIVQ